MTEKIHHYDIVIIGSGPAGEKAAMQASKLRKKVVLIEKDPVHIGGSSLHTGTIPSKSLRETVVNLELLRRRTHGIKIQFRDNITAKELMYHKDWVIEEHENSYRRNLRKTGVDLIHGEPTFKATSATDSEQYVSESGEGSTAQAETSNVEPMDTEGTAIRSKRKSRSKKSKASKIDTMQGTARFRSPTLLEVTHAESDKPISIVAKKIIVATGSSPNRPDWAEFDCENVFDSDTILNIQKLPRKLTIIGAGVIGCEYACIFAKLGIRVNLVAKDYSILGWLDHEIADKLKERMRESRITLRFGEDVSEVKVIGPKQVETRLVSGKVLRSDAVMIAAGRISNSQGFGLEEIGVKLGKRGLIEVNRETYQTSVPNIYAVGDVVGFPGLASTAMLQARIAVLHAFDQLQNEQMPTALAFGIWTIPPIGMVGKTEKELTEAQIPYEIGVANFKEIARARIMGEDRGIMKLLFSPEDLKLLGVHIIGPRAMEMIHLGQSVLFYGGTINYFMNSVFNYPTLDQAYQVAAFNGINRMTFDL